MFFRALNWIEETFLALLLAAMTIITFSQVVARKVFDSGAVWALELTSFIFAWLVLMGMSWGIRVGAHIGVDLLVRALPTLARRIVGGIGIALCLAYACIMLWSSWDVVQLLHMIDIEAEDLPIPTWIPHLALPIGFSLLVLRLLEAGWELIRGRSDGLGLADEVDEALELFERDKDDSAGAKA